MVSIIITHYQTPILLKLCLNSICQNIGGLKHEIIVTDGESQEKTRQMILDKFPQVKFIPFVKNVGYAKMANAGIRQAQGEYLFILNADTILLEETLPKLLAYLEENPEVGLVGPQLVGFNNRPQKSCFAFPTPGAILARRTFWGRLKWGREKLNQFLLEGKDLAQPVPVDWLQGSAMLARRSAVEKVGLLDERFFMYLEDTDWCRRFWNNNFKVVYLPEAQMSHYYYRISKKRGGLLDLLLNKYTRLHIASAIKYFWKHRYN